MFFFVHRTAASCLYIDGDIFSYFTLAGYVLWFYAYQQETFCSKEDVVESGKVAALIWCTLRHVRSLCMRLCITHGENHGAAQRQHHHDGDGILDPTFRNRFHIVDLLSNLVVLRDGCIIRQNA